MNFTVKRGTTLIICAALSVGFTWYLIQNDTPEAGDEVSESAPAGGSKPGALDSGLLDAKAMHAHPEARNGENRVASGSAEVLTPQVKATRRMYGAHVSLRSSEVADPDSEANRRVLQSMVEKALTRRETAR